MLLIASALFVAVLYKEGFLSSKTIVANKDLIDALSKVLTSLGLIVGAVLSYFRFFKGRTFRSKLVMSCQSGMIPLMSSNLHWLNIQIENKGSVAIWNYDLRVEATYHGPNPANVPVDQFLVAPGEDETAERLIDVGESSFVHAILEVPQEVPALSFRVSVTDQAGAFWEQFLTASNLKPEPNPNATPDANRAARGRRR